MTVNTVHPGEITETMRGINAMRPVALAPVVVEETERTCGITPIGQMREYEIPHPLVGEFLTSEGVTVLYGSRGVGKSYLALYFAWELAKKGERVLILDFEFHPSEWTNRVKAAHVPERDQGFILWCSPDSDEWTNPRGTLKEIAPYLAKDIAELGITYVILDSFSTSTSTGEGMGGQKPAVEFFDGIKELGIDQHVLVLAHTRSDAGNWPTSPWGSSHTGNQAREMWCVQKAEDETDYVPGVASLIVNHKLELRCTKRSNGTPPLPQFMNIEHAGDNEIRFIVEHPPIRYLKDKIRSILLAGGAEGMTSGAIATAVRAEGDPCTTKSAYQELRRHPQDFTPTGLKWNLV